MPHSNPNEVVKLANKRRQDPGTRTRPARDHIHHGGMLRALKAGDPQSMVAALRADLIDGIEPVVQYLREHTIKQPLCRTWGGKIGHACGGATRSWLVATG